jgi:DNA invertase Pin-like site-specific DNA recombinase
MPTVYCYGRASTDKQALTEDNQKMVCEDYVTRTMLPQGFTYGGWLYDPATSGTTQMFERPQGRNLWALVQPGDAIVWAKLDRAFRSVLDATQAMQLLAHKQVSFVSLDLGLDTGSPIGRCVFTILAAFAELEVSFTRQRTRDGMAVKKRSGKPYTKHAPIGWSKVGKKDESYYAPNMEERAQVEAMIRLRDGGMSLERIVWAMRPVRRTNGKAWNINSVSAAIKAGRTHYAKEFPSGPSPRSASSVSSSRLAPSVLPTAAGSSSVQT